MKTLIYSYVAENYILHYVCMYVCMHQLTSPTAIASSC